MLVLQHVSLVVIPPKSRSATSDLLQRHKDRTGATREILLRPAAALICSFRAAVTRRRIWSVASFLLLQQIIVLQIFIFDSRNIPSIIVA